MLKTLAAIGISAGIALAPLAALAQSDTTAPAAASKMAPAKHSMKKTKHKHHMAKKKMMKKEEAPKG